MCHTGDEQERALRFDAQQARLLIGGIDSLDTLHRPAIDQTVLRLQELIERAAELLFEQARESVRG